MRTNYENISLMSIALPSPITLSQRNQPILYPFMNIACSVDGNQVHVTLGQRREVSIYILSLSVKHTPSKVLTLTMREVLGQKEGTPKDYLPVCRQYRHLETFTQESDSFVRREYKGRWVYLKDIPYILYAHRDVEDTRILTPYY